MNDLQSDNRVSLLTLAAALLAAAFWFVLPQQVGWWPVVAVLLPLPLLVGKRLLPWRPTTVDWVLLLFMATALVGVWAAYDPAAAWQKLRMLLGALLVYAALSGLPRRHVTAVSGLWGGVGTVVALYFLLTHNWVDWPADVALLTQAGQRWMAVRPQVGWAPLHPNVAGGIIALFLPLGALFAWEAWRQRRWGWLGITAVAAGITLAGWLLTSSRGAWLSLLLAAALAGWWWLSRSMVLRRRAPDSLFGGGLWAALLLGLLLLLFWPGGPAQLVDKAAGQVQGISRLTLAGQTLDLIRDFPWTGGGLAAYGGLYSQYIRVIPFFFFSYGHNLFLDVWLGQGPLGLAALLAVLFLTGRWLLAALREPDAAPAVPLALAAALVVLVVHGLVDDALYGTLGTPFLWVVPGLAAAWQRPLPQKRELLVPAVAGAGILGVTLLLAGNPAAAWQANLGAVQMARQELAGWPAGEWADGSEAAALATAVAHFEDALRTDPAQVTAHYHLGRVAMLRRDFAAAVGHLEQAHLLDPDHRGIRKNLGYSYVWLGRYEAAAPLLATIPESVQEMDVYVWWWQEQGRGDLSERARQMAQQP